MAIPKRRASARLSGGSTNGEQQESLVYEALDSLTRKKRNSANGTNASVDGPTNKPNAEEGTRKRQKTDKPAATRKPKPAMTFKPIPIAAPSGPSLDGLAPDRRPPPPPPSVRRPARQIPSIIPERSPSPPAIPINAGSSSQVQRPVASLSGDGAKQGKGKMAVKPSNGNIGIVDQTGLGGLDGEVTLEAELGQEQRRWNDMVERGTTSTGATSSTSAGLNHLEFKSPEYMSFTAPRPISPPRMAPTASDFQTPRASRRMKSIPVDLIEPISLGDTPMIRRNQEMRREASRRSSLGARGSRMNESIGRGEISAPHSSVPHSTLYKHLGNDLPQTIRARHLMLWCIKRALETDKQVAETARANAEKAAKSRSRSKGKSKELPKTVEGDELVASIINDLLRAQSQGEIEDQIFSMMGESKPDSGLRPHPRNVSNREVEVKFNKDIARDKAEEAEWIAIFARVNSHRTQVVAEQQAVKRKQVEHETDDSEDVPAFTGREAGIEHIQTWADIAQEVLQAGDDIEAMPLDDVEYHVDILHQASHAALQYSATAKRFLDGIFASLAQDVRNRDQIGAPSTSRDAHNADREAGGPPTIAGFMQGVQPTVTSRPTSGIEILKGLSAQDDPAQAEEMAKILESLPPPAGPSSTRRPANTGSSSLAASGSMTPRRHGPGMGITPRKIGRLGSSTPRRERELSRGPASPSKATTISSS